MASKQVDFHITAGPKRNKAGTIANSRSQISHVTSESRRDMDPYVLLVGAIISRAIADALGQTQRVRAVQSNIAIFREQAVNWLMNDDALDELIAATEADPDEVIPIIRQCAGLPSVQKGIYGG